MTGTRVSAVTAYTAHREWASRPPDERYASVHALYEAARTRRARLEERTTETVDLRTMVVDDDDLAIRNTSGRTAALTHWSFGQLATVASAPPSYLRTLPAAIVSSAINYGLQRFARDEYHLFIEPTAPWTVHAITSPRYARVQHDELADEVAEQRQSTGGGGEGGKGAGQRKLAPAKRAPDTEPDQRAQCAGASTASGKAG